MSLILLRPTLKKKRLCIVVNKGVYMCLRFFFFVKQFNLIEPHRKIDLYTIDIGIFMFKQVCTSRKHSISNIYISIVYNFKSPETKVRSIKNLVEMSNIIIHSQ